MVFLGFQAVVANMISIFRKMSPGHYDQYIHNFNVNDPAGRCDLVTILFKKNFIRLFISFMPFT